MKHSSRKTTKLTANFTEDVVGFALESFLTQIGFPFLRFSIEPFSRSKERWLGADARLHSNLRGFRPFYMQFKRPEGYPDHSRSKVITDRKSLGLQISPITLSFPLRGKQPHHFDFQHNILLRLRNRLQSKGIGDAAYICPKFLDRSSYRLSLHWAGLLRWRPWARQPWDIEELLVDVGGSQIRFGRMPVLAEHVSIPPHAAVNSANHRYSFTEAGTELCFHSPLSLPEQQQSLADFMKSIFGGFLDGGQKILVEDANRELAELVEEVFSESTKIDPGFAFSLDDDPFGNWNDWGDFLAREFEIEQYAFMLWDR